MDLSAGDAVGKVLSGEATDVSFGAFVPSFDVISDLLTKQLDRISDAVGFFSPYCGLPFILALWKQFSSRLSILCQLASPFPDLRSKISTFARRHWGHIVLGRPDCERILRFGADHLVNKSCTFPNPVVSHPEKLLKFLGVLTQSSFLIQNEFSWLFLSNAFECYLVQPYYRPANIEGGLRKIDELLRRGRSKAIAESVLQTFQSISIPIISLYGRKQENTQMQSPKQIVQFPELIQLSEMLNQTHLNFASELISRPLLNVQLRRVPFQKIVSVENFFGLLRSVEAGAVPVVNFALKAISPIKPAYEQLIVFKFLVPIESLSWLDVFDEAHVAVFMPLWTRYLSKLDCYRDVVKEKFFEGIARGKSGDELMKACELFFDLEYEPEFLSGVSALAGLSHVDGISWPMVQP
jgi:hypothetical protein